MPIRFGDTEIQNLYVGSNPVRAVYLGGELAWIPIGEPSPTFSGATTNSLTIAWAAIENATGYEYRFRTASATNYGEWVSVGTALTVTITGLTINTAYSVQVRAVGSGGVASTPGEVDLTTALLSTLTSLRRTGSSTGTITVAWNAVAGATGYEGRWARSANGLPDKWTDFGKGTSRTITGLSSGSSYVIEVRAYAGDDKSGAARITASTSSPPPPRVPSFGVNAVPRWSYVSFDVETGIYTFRGWAVVSVANPSSGVSYSGTGTQGTRTLRGKSRSQTATISGTVTGTRRGYQSRSVRWSVQVATF